MTESTQGIQNKWLLVIALALALIVVFLYNAHIRAIRAEREGDTIAVVELQKDIAVGQKLTSRHIGKAIIPKDSQNEYKKIVPWNQRDTLTVGDSRVVFRALRKGGFLLWDDIYKAAGEKASSKLGDGMVGIPIEFDRDQSLGDILSPGDTINLKGVFSAPSGTCRTYRIISHVRVMNVGGRGAAEAAGAPGRALNYRRITIEVSPEVSLKISNLMTHMVSPMQIEIQKAGPIIPADAGKINPDLESLAAQAKATTPSGAAVPAAIPPAFPGR